MRRQIHCSIADLRLHEPNSGTRRNTRPVHRCDGSRCLEASRRQWLRAGCHTRATYQCQGRRQGAVLTQLSDTHILLLIFVTVLSGCVNVSCIDVPPGPTRTSILQ